MSQSILVTGGAGYVGSHACKALAGAGYRPVVYDNLSRGHRVAVRWGPLVEGDLHDTARLAAALREHQVTAVMHFAAFAYVGESRGGGFADRLLVDLRGLWHARASADPRDRGEGAAQPLRRNQAGDRAGVALVRRRLWPALH